MRPCFPLADGYGRHIHLVGDRALGQADQAPGLGKPRRIEGSGDSRQGLSVIAGNGVRADHKLHLTRDIHTVILHSGSSLPVCCGGCCGSLLGGSPTGGRGLSPRSSFNGASSKRPVRSRSPCGATGGLGVRAPAIPPSSVPGKSSQWCQITCPVSLFTSSTSPKPSS